MSKDYIATQKWVKELLSSGTHALVTQGSALVSVVSGEPAVVTIPHQVSVLICQIYSTADVHILVLGSDHTSDVMSGAYPRVTLINNSSSAEVSFSPRDSATAHGGTVHYYAIG